MGRILRGILLLFYKKICYSLINYIYRGESMRKRDIIGIAFMTGCLAISGCTRENDNEDVTRGQQSENVRTEADTEIETQSREGIYGIETSLNIEEMNMIREKYSYIFDAIDMPENIIYTSILAEESDDGEICIAFTGVDDNAKGANEISNYGRIIRYRDNAGTPEMSVMAMPSRISQSRISALYYNNGICVIGTKNGAGNIFGKVTIYRNYNDNNRFEEYSVDCSEYGVSEENQAYVSDVYMDNEETYCEVVIADGDKTTIKLPFVGNTMRNLDEYIAELLGLDGSIHDGMWTDNVIMYESDIDGDGTDEYIVSLDGSCLGLVHAGDYRVLYTYLFDNMRSDDYLSDVSMSLSEIQPVDEPEKYRYLTFTLTGVNGESYEKEVFILNDYYERYSGISFDFTFTPVYDEYDGTLTMNGNFMADYDKYFTNIVIDTVHIKMVYDERCQGMTLSDEYVLGPFDTRKMPGEDIRLDDCEIMTGTRDEIRAFIGTPDKMEAYSDWEMFLIKIDNHWRVGYYKDGAAVIVYYNSGPYMYSQSGEGYEGKVCIVARADRKDGFKFGEWQLENLGIDIDGSDYRIMRVSDNDGDGSLELMAGMAAHDDADDPIWYNEINLKK